MCAPTPYSYAYYTGAVTHARRQAVITLTYYADSPLLVVFMGINNNEEVVTWASLYSLKTHDWSTRTTAYLSGSTTVDPLSYIEMKAEHSYRWCTLLHT